MFKVFNISFVFVFRIIPRSPPSPERVGKVLNIISDIYDNDNVVGIRLINIYASVFCIGLFSFCGYAKCIPVRYMLYIIIKLEIPKKYRKMFEIVLPMLPHKFDV